jgi:hypothetical protein
MIKTENYEGTFFLLCSRGCVESDDKTETNLFCEYYVSNLLFLRYPRLKSGSIYTAWFSIPRKFLPRTILK